MTAILTIAESTPTNVTNGWDALITCTVIVMIGFCIWCVHRYS